MRVEGAVTSLSWVPPDAVEGLPKLPVALGLAHDDEPPPVVLGNVDRLLDAAAFRAANELRAWIDVRDGRIVGHGREGRGVIGRPRGRLGGVAFAPVAFPTLAPEPEVGDAWVRFVQTAGGTIGFAAPRRVPRRPYVRLAGATAWTTLALTLHADGRAEGELVGASAFPRHWLYGGDGRLVAKSATLAFDAWHREAHGAATPWDGGETSAHVTAAESELERALGDAVLRLGGEIRRRRVSAGATLTEQGASEDDLFLVLDGVVAVEVDGRVVAEVGPGAVLGELAVLEDGLRTATLRAVTACRVAVAESERFSRYELAELALGRHTPPDRPDGPAY